MKGIYNKINNIMKKVEFVTKDGVLGYGNNQFRVVTHDKVLSVVRKHFVEEGILVIPCQVDKGVSIEGKTKNGGDKIRFECLYYVTFADMEDGSEIVIKTEVHAEDNSDKAANKAITYAVKNAILKILMLQSGDDEGNEVVNKVTETQMKMLQNLVTSSGANEQEFLAYYGASTYADFPQNSYQGAVDTLQKKLKNKGKQDAAAKSN